MSRPRGNARRPLCNGGQWFVNAAWAMLPFLAIPSAGLAQRGFLLARSASEERTKTPRWRFGLTVGKATDPLRYFRTGFALSADRQRPARSPIITRAARTGPCSADVAAAARYDVAGPTTRPALETGESVRAPLRADAIGSITIYHDPLDSPRHASMIDSLSLTSTSKTVR